jgi:RNA recognition motif-containing protein
VPKFWSDEQVFEYFKRYGAIFEARIIRDKSDGSHRGCAFLKVQNFHEAEIILKQHKPRQHRLPKQERDDDIS